MCRRRSEYLVSTNTSEEIMFRLLAHRIIDDMPFNELATLFDFSKLENGGSKGSVDFKAHLVVNRRVEVVPRPIPPKGRLLNDTSTTASLLKTLRDLSGAAVLAVAVIGLFAEKIPAREIPTLMALATCSGICCALSIWGLKVWYPKNERND